MSENKQIQSEYNNLPEKIKQIVFLVANKGYNMLDACAVVFPNRTRPRQIAYEIRKKFPNLNNFIDAIKENKIKYKCFTNLSLHKNLEKNLPNILERKNTMRKKKIREFIDEADEFLQKKVSIRELTNNPNQIRIELARIYLNVEGHWSNEQRLKALEMLGKTFALFSEKNLSFNIKADIDDETLLKLLKNYQQNVQQNLLLSQQEFPKLPDKNS